jgi:hypothetical protein
MWSFLLLLNCELRLFRKTWVLDGVVMAIALVGIERGFWSRQLATDHDSGTAGTGGAW